MFCSISADGGVLFDMSIHCYPSSKYEILMGGHEYIANRRDGAWAGHFCQSLNSTKKVNFFPRIFSDANDSNYQWLSFPNQSYPIIE